MYSTRPSYLLLLVVTIASLLASFPALSAHLHDDFATLKPPKCDIFVRVDPTHTNSDTQYTLQKDSQNETLNLTFSDLQEVLVVLNTTVFHKINGCVEVLVSKGFYIINDSVQISQNLRILGEGIDEVFVGFDVYVSSNLSFFNVLTFLDAEYVMISGIQFSNSPGSIAIENVTEVRVCNCLFQWFSRGALDIYQCYATLVENCTFEDNGFVGVTKFDYQYRGHSGGLSVGFDDNHYNINGTDINTVPDVRGLIVSNCVFRNNTSDPQESGSLQSTSQLLQRFIFPGRGGAIAITINTSFAFDTSVERCVIEDSFAPSFGGGLYLGYSGYAAHTSVVKKTVFSRNRCVGPSGGLQLGFIEGGSNGHSVRLEVYDSEFYENEAEYGGAIHVFSNQSSNDNGVIMLSNVARFENCTFERNTALEYGAAMSVASLLFLVDSHEVQPLSIVDCTFAYNNGGRAGVLSTAYLPLAFYGRNEFLHNRGRVLVISGTRADIHGAMHFQSNDGTALDGGALYIASFGQLQLHKGADILFEQNSGVFGASIVVVAEATISNSYAKLLYNPLCVLRSANTTERPQDWKDVRIEFSENTALFGSAVLMNNVNFCAWTDQGPDFFHPDQVFRWNFVNYTKDNVNTAHHPNETDPLWYVQTPATKIFLTGSDNITAYPGEHFSLNVTGLDQLGLHTSVAVRLSDIQAEYVFSPSAAAPEVIQSSSIKTEYFVNVHTEEEVLHFEPKNITISTIFTQKDLSLPFTLTPTACPVGYFLNHRETDNDLQHFCDCNEENNEYLTYCDHRHLVLVDGLWGVLSQHEGSMDGIVAYPCPYHYCQCLGFDEDMHISCKSVFDPDNPNKQCHSSRKGELCGDCKEENAGFTALLNNCEPCGYENLLLIFTLLVVDAVVIALLLLIKTSPPSWIYPALFYLQALPYLTMYFPVTFEVVHPYVYYVSSALSFYFIYDFCLGPNFSALSNYFVRFLPLLVSIAVTIPVIVLRYRYHLKNKPWPGLWWVVLFQYTHVIHTCISILNCPLLPGSDGQILGRWFVNANVTCFNDLHIPLALFAVIVLVLCLMGIPLILLYTLDYLKRPKWLLNSILPSTSTFKKGIHWWCAMELTRRVLLVVFVIAFPGKDFAVTTFLMMTIAVCLFIQPYKAFSANIIEAFLSVNVLVMMLLRGTDVGLGYKSIFLPLRTINSSEAIDSSIHVLSISAAILTPLYFIPLVFFVLASCVSVSLTLRFYYLQRKYKKRPSIEYDPYDPNIQQSFYYRAEQEPTTGTIEVSNSPQVPLSKILGRIFGYGRRNTKVDFGQVSTPQKQVNSLDRQGTFGVKSRTFKASLHRRFNSIHRYRSPTTLSMPVEINVQRHEQNSVTKQEQLSEVFEHVELRQVADNYLENDPFEDIEVIGI